MSDVRRVIPAGSREEAEVAESLLLGLIHGLLLTNGPIIRGRFHYRGVTLTRAPEPETGVRFSELVIHMASGDYEVKVSAVDER